MVIWLEISDHKRAYWTGTTCSWGSLSTCKCSINWKQISSPHESFYLKRDSNLNKGSSQIARQLGIAHASQYDFDGKLLRHWINSQVLTVKTHLAEQVELMSAPHYIDVRRQQVDIKWRHLPVIYKHFLIFDLSWSSKLSNRLLCDTITVTKHCNLISVIVFL